MVGSYLAQVILLSKRSVEYLIGTCKGQRLVGVHFASASSKKDRWVFSVHLPHSQNDDEQGQSSLRELEEF